MRKYREMLTVATVDVGQTRDYTVVGGVRLVGEQMCLRGEGEN